jgi:hypothetical protein
VRGSVVVVALVLLTCNEGSAQAPESMRVLFVGNSYTRFNDLPAMVTRLGAARGRPITTDLAFVAGATLRDQWRRRLARRLLRRGRFTHVVLQGHSLDPFERPAELEEYARRFEASARAAGAETVLYQTWPRAPDSRLYRRGMVARSPEEMARRIRDVYRAIGARLDLRVAPVGDAFLASMRELPRMRLHWPDGSHPTRRGSYLAACVIYGALTGDDPRASDYRPPYLTDARARHVRAIAAAALARK